MENITILTDRGLSLGKNRPLTTLGAHVAKLSLITASLGGAWVSGTTRGLLDHSLLYGCPLSH